MMRPVDLAKACAYCGVSPHRPPKGLALVDRCSECESLPPSFQQARSAFPYDSPAGAIVRNMKYQRAPFLAEYLVKYSSVVLDEWLEDICQRATVVPMPMSLRRQLHKGFNQAEELARALAVKYHAQVLREGVFHRTRTGSPQARFHTHAERVSNVADIFFVKLPEAVSGLSLLLVDDVMTTGATVGAAAKALIDAGAREVFVYTPVRARLGEDDGDESESVRLD